MKKLYFFLGSVYFAVGLIAASALFAVLGTFAESWSQSHRFAAQLSYRNPVFLGLLSLFFVNILLSALRRWPFQKKHVPFLITHFGLLMIIAGVMIKNSFGVQGQMGLIEGAASDTLIIPETYVLHVHKRDGNQQFSLQESPLIHYYPHCRQFYETWIKGKFAFLEGIKPFPVYTFDGSDVKPSSRMKIPHDRFEYWDLYAYLAEDAQEVAKLVYQEGLKATCTDRKTAIQREVSGELLWGEEPIFVLDGCEIPLSGPQALLNLPYGPAAVDLSAAPKLLFVKEKSGDTHFFAFDGFGQTFHQLFPASELTHYIAYDQGFGGYAVQAEVPLPLSRKEREHKILAALGEQIATDPLPPPLELLKSSSNNFPEQFAAFLLEQPKNLNINWETVSERDQRGCKWGALLLEKKELKEWPLASLMVSISDPNALTTALLQQVLMIADELPEPPEEVGSEKMLEAYFLAYGLHPSLLLQGLSQTDHMQFECPLTVRHEPLEPLKKLEDNRPMVVLRDYQTLAYDPYGVGLSWPKGDALYSFRSETKKIPHKIRLRDARQINYPGEEQAYSYESDLLITDLVTGRVEEKTVSMNEVYETGDGYRFYLSNVYPQDESRAQRVQLIVNRDPAKYWLTYPGGLIVALGVALLFWRNR